MLLDVSVYVNAKETMFADKTTAVETASKVEEEPRFLEMVKMIFDKAVPYCNVPPDYLNMIKACNTAVRFFIPLKRDDGSIETLACYRAQHSHHKLPVKGGTRYAPNVSI